jgi:hypothetical protein
MTKEEAIKRLTDMHKLGGLIGLEVEDRQALSMGIDALEVKPCEDAISRAEVIKLIDKHTNDDGTLDDDITCILEELPPIQPKVKVGHWIPTYGNVKCSVCGNVKDSRNVGKATHYCDFCGAKIESEVEK